MTKYTGIHSFCKMTIQPLKYKLKPPVRAVLAKQNRVGYTLVDIIVKVYSHPFESILADFPSKCKDYTVVTGSFFLNTKYLYPMKFQMNVTAIPASGETISTHSFVEGPADFTSVATTTFTTHPMSATA
jgi:hypothetical protein